MKKHLLVIFEFDEKENGAYHGGIKQVSGDPVMIGKCIGKYANDAMKTSNNPTTAMILLNAYHIFKSENPDLTRDIENKLIQESGGIIRPYR